MGVLGVPLYPGGALNSIYMYLIRLSMEKWKVYRFLICSLWGVPIRSRPILFFKFVWGLPAGTDDPKNDVVDDLPRYGSSIGTGTATTLQAIELSLLCRVFASVFEYAAVE